MQQLCNSDRLLGEMEKIVQFSAFRQGNSCTDMPGYTILFCFYYQAFFHSLIYEKQIKFREPAKYKDMPFLVSSNMSEVNPCVCVLSILTKYDLFRQF